MKQEVEISQQITFMNQEQVEALNKQEKKAFLKTFIWTLFFCLLNVILGYGEVIVKIGEKNG